VLEKYEKNFDEKRFVDGYMAKKGIKTRKQAIAMLRKEIPRESYYQDKIKKAIKKRFPGAFVRKIAQGAYSEGGTPDIMVIWHGHYFGFEVKRPVVGEPSKLQEKAVEQICAAGGIAEFITWPEQAISTMLGIYQMDECIGDCQICRHAITKADQENVKRRANGVPALYTMFMQGNKGKKDPGKEGH